MLQRSIVPKSLAWMGVLALPLGGFLARAADVPDNEQVTKLLSETKTMAFQLKEDAGVMESFTRMNVSFETQAATINEFKAHVNTLKKQEAKLQEVKGAAAPWQKAAIEQITPFLDELDGYTFAIIDHLNGTPKHNFAEYKDYLEANADYATDLAAMIADYVNYGKTKERLERLGAKLEVPSTR
ncbi:MAG TPA: hypothetical protein VIY49_04015 [Bryobacteraceae bacterium]